jgi:putative thioredoxin
LAGDHERALEQLLEIVRHDRKFRDPARKAMLAVFNLLGNRGELVKKYRALLSSALN